MLNNAQFCCNDMEYNVTESNIISYSSKFDEYGIVIPDDGVSYMLLSYCPWCGSRLPISKRDDWFDQLESLGFDDPLFDDSIPEEFKTSSWWKDMGQGDGLREP